MKTLLIIPFLGFCFYGFSGSLFAQKNPEYLIAYNVLQDEKTDDYEVYIMNMDGGEKRNITNNKDVAWTYYAHKTKIFFVSDRDTCKRCYLLYEMDANGENIRKVFDQRLNDSWMSTRNNGREIIVSPRLKDRQEFFILNVATGKIVKKIPLEFAQISDPAFSPNGKQIAFRASREKRTKDSKTFDELYIIDADGENLRPLTNYPKDDKTAKWHSYHAGPPQWNPSGEFITYQSFQNGKSSLFAVTPDGKKNWKLTDHELNEGWHSWSPDGKWMAIEMYNKEETEFGIYLINVATKEVKKLTTKDDFTYQQAPVFVEKIDPRAGDRAELLRLHKQHQTAHLTYDAELFVSSFAENLPQITRGEVSTLSKAENLARIKQYFSSYKFLEWEDIKPPIIKISKDGSMATKVVEKRVRGSYKNDEGEPIEDHTIFAWLEVWEKIDGRWKVTMVASTSRVPK